MTRKGRTVRSRENETALPELERMLTVAAAGQVKESSAGAGSLGRAIRVRPSRVVAVGLACLAFGGTAVAAGVWNPGLGTNLDSRSLSYMPTAASSPVPSAVTDTIGVFGGEQTDLDRNAEVEATLSNLSFVDGIRLDSVRNVGPGVDGEATIVFSAEKTGEFFTQEEPVCIYRPTLVGDDAAPGCFGLSQILSGNGRMTYHNMPAGLVLAFGLVPDGIASVTAKFGSSPERTVPVQNNYFEFELSGAELSNANGESGVQQTVWRDADGEIVPQLPGDGYPGAWADGYPDDLDGIFPVPSADGS